MLNILYYIPSVSTSSGGIYQYSMSLLETISDGDYRIFIISRYPSDELNHLISRKSNLTLISNKHLTRSFGNLLIYKFVRFYSIIKNKVFKRNHSIKRDYLYSEIVRKFKIDVVHCPYQDLLVTDKVPSITTMHDVQELHFPEFFSSAERAYRAVHFKSCIDNADSIIVSYDHVKSDIVKFFNKPISKVFVCLNRMDTLWFTKIEEKENQNLKNESQSDFVLYPAATWQHKNHISLIRAISVLHKQYGCNIKLVCTGKITEYAKLLDAEITDLNLEDFISFRGIVSHEELYRLYRTAKAVVVPTLYEAGSFPLIESIFLNVPVICSNVTSLPETIGEERFTFNPLDINDISAKLHAIISDVTYRDDNINLIKKQRKRLVDTNILENINEVYASTVASRK